MTAHPTPQTSVVRIPAGAHWLECELSAAGSAAIMVAAARPHEISAVVSCGGRGDLAGSALKRVMAPTLLMVGGLDTIVIRLNREALARMSAEVVMEIVPGATHLFAEADALDRVLDASVHWFSRFLGRTYAARAETLAFRSPV